MTTPGMQQIDGHLSNTARSVVLFERCAGASDSIADDQDQGWARDGCACWGSRRAVSRGAMPAGRSRCGAGGSGRSCRPQALLPGAVPAGLGNPVDFSLRTTPLSTGVWSRKSARCGSRPIACWFMPALLGRTGIARRMDVRMGGVRTHEGSDRSVGRWSRPAHTVQGSQALSNHINATAGTNRPRR